MAVSTLNPDGTTATSKREARPIYVDAQGISDLLTEGKNKTLNVTVHQDLAKLIYEKVAEDSTATLIADGRTMLKRPRLTAFLRSTLASALDYTGPLANEGRKGGISTTSAVRSIVAALFDMAHSMGERYNIPEEQNKASSFAIAKESIAADPNLKGVTIDDAILEALWANANIELDEEPEDDDDEEDD